MNPADIPLAAKADLMDAIKQVAEKRQYANAYYKNKASRNRALSMQLMIKRNCLGRHDAGVVLHRQ